MTKVIHFRKFIAHAGDDLIIKNFINNVLTQETVWQEIFISPFKDININRVLNEIAHNIRQIPEHELIGFGLSKIQALDGFDNFYLSTELYECTLDNSTTKHIITYKQILAAAYKLLIKDKPTAQQKEIATLFVGILQNRACAGGRANTCVEHYNNAINQYKEEQWKILPTNAEYLLHYLINFYATRLQETARIGVIPKPENNTFLQICWAIFEKHVQNNRAATHEAIQNIITGMSPHEHFGGQFMTDRNNINTARHRLEQYQAANGNMPGLTEEQKNVLAQVFNQQHPYRPLNTQENTLIQKYVIDEEAEQTDVAFTPLSIGKVKRMWQSLIEKSLVFGAGIIPGPNDNVRIDFNNPNRDQPFIIGEVDNDYIINHYRLRIEEARYKQANAQVYLDLSRKFFGEIDETCTKLFAATVSRELGLFNNRLNLNSITRLTDLDNAFNERLQWLAMGIEDVDGLNLVDNKDEKKVIFIESNWTTGLKIKQEIEELLAREKTLLKQLELDKHINAGHIINQTLHKQIDNKIGKLVLAEALAYAGTSTNVSLFLEKLSDNETIEFFNLSNQESLTKARELGEELRRLNVRLFETIPSFLRKRNGSVHKGSAAIIDVEDPYNQNPDLRSNNKFLQICYASMAEAAQHFTQADIENDEDIKLIHKTFNFNLTEDDDQHFEGITREHPSINQGKQALAEFRDWIVNGKQGRFPGLRPVDVELLEELEIAKIALQPQPAGPDTTAAAEAERRRQQQAEQERQRRLAREAAEAAEAERLRQQQAEQERQRRLAREAAEAERLRQQQAEQERQRRLAREAAEAERRRQQQAEQERQRRLAREAAEAERLRQQQAEQEHQRRLAREAAEAERRRQQQAEQELQRRLAREAAEAERRRQQQAEAQAAAAQQPAPHIPAFRRRKLI